MAQGSGGKRKRGDRSYSQDNLNEGSRPSPHRPDALRLAQHNQSNYAHHNYNRDSPGRGGRRGGRGGRQPNSPNSPRQQHQQQRPPSSTSNSLPSPAPVVPSKTVQSVESEAKPAPTTNSTAIQTAPEREIPVDYDYEDFTQSVVSAWDPSRKQSIIEKARSAKKDSNLPALQRIYQETLRSGLDERIPVLEAADIIAQIVNDSKAESTTPVLDTISAEDFLDVVAVSHLYEAHHPHLQTILLNCGIPLDLIRSILDDGMLEELKLVRTTFAQTAIRHGTNVLYRMKVYNLLKEETEGYSKLVTELFTTSGNEPPTPEVITALLTRTVAMIGTFNMDVGRVFDIILDVFAAVLVKQNRFFLKYLRSSFWWPSNLITEPCEAANLGLSSLPKWAEPDAHGLKALSEEEKADLAHARRDRDRAFWKRVKEIGTKAYFELNGQRAPPDFVSNLPSMSKDVKAFFEEWINSTGTLPPLGNKAAAHILGFKLRFYESRARDEEDTLPANLIYLSALLIKVGFISLFDLYPHLWPDDDDMNAVKEQKQKEKNEKDLARRPGGGMNALTRAGALSDDTVPPQSRRTADASAPSGTTSSEIKDEKSTPQGTNQAGPKSNLPEPADQKIQLLRSLLCIGALPEALYMLGRFPWLPELVSDIPDHIHRILHYSLGPVYEPLRPLKDLASPQEPAKIVDLDEPTTQNGDLRLVDQPPRKVLRWAQLDKVDASEGIDYKFYWEDWVDNVPACHDIDEVFLLCDTFLNFSGLKIGRDPTLLAKLARIGIHSLDIDSSTTNKTRWFDLCKRLLVPALSFADCNSGIVNEVWALLNRFPTAKRYNVYSEWYQGQISRNPDLAVPFDMVKSRTKDVLKRISKTNIREMARAFAKATVASPGKVFEVALNQVESYDNLIDVVVEASRYFTDMAYDILTWSLVNALGKQRSRVQEDGMLTSKWLASLGRFSGSVFKRYSSMNATPVIQYVVHQLQNGNSADLVVLTDLIKSMTGIVSDIDFNDAQVVAMTGGPVLRYEILQLLQDQRHHHSMKTSARRLMRALTDSKMVGPLLVALSQERQACVYRYEAPDGSVPPLKLLGNLFDEIHKVLVQYIDLLHTHLDQEEFTALVPSIAELIGDFGLEPNVAFWIWRPYIAGEIVQYDRTAASEKITTTTKSPHGNQEGLTEPQIKTSEDTIMTDSQPQESGVKEDEQTLGEHQVAEGMTEKSMTALDSQASKAAEPAYIWHPVSQKIMDSLRPVLPASTFTSLTEAFYCLFWRLSPYDMHIPEAYQDECRKLITKIEASKKERNDLRSSAAKQKEQTQYREEQRRAWTGLHSKISTEHKEHLAAHLRTRASLLKEKDFWFERGSGYEDLSIALLEHCFIPRMLLSSVDAFFVFKMFKFLHAQGTKNFKTVGIIDTLFNHKRLVSVFFMCTAKEAEHFGRFLNEILKDLAKWHSSPEVFEKEAHGPKKDLFGFFVKGSLLNYENFRTILSKWHSALHDALKTCFSSNEYMHIRNAVIVLKAVVPTFPAISWIGESLVKHVTEISERDARSDLKLAALSLLGNVKRHSKQWVSKQEFALNKPVINGSSTPKPAPSRSKTPQPENRNANKSLNAKAPEFVPSGPSSLNSSKPTSGPRLDGQEDGEIKDGVNNQQSTAPTNNKQGPGMEKENIPEKGSNAISAASKVNAEVKASTPGRQPSPKPRPSDLPAKVEQRPPSTLQAPKLRPEAAKAIVDALPPNRISHSLPDRPEATNTSRTFGQRQSDRPSDQHLHNHVDTRDAGYRRHERPPGAGRESMGERTDTQRGFDRQEKAFSNNRDKRDTAWGADTQSTSRPQDIRHTHQARDSRPPLREERSDRNLRDRPYLEQRNHRAEADNQASKSKDDSMAPPRSAAVIPSDRGPVAQSPQEQNRGHQYKQDERRIEPSRHHDNHPHVSSHRSSRTSSPTRHDERPSRMDHHAHRDERGTVDNRRYGESNTSHRYDDSKPPTGPRTDRPGEFGHSAQGDRSRDNHRSFPHAGAAEANPGRSSQDFGRSRQPQESQYGRLNQDPPAGPRLPNGTHAPPVRSTRNVNAPQLASETRESQQPAPAAVSSALERTTPTGPSAGRGPSRNQPTANRPPPVSTTIPPASVSESPDTAGVHPDRLRAIQSSGLGGSPQIAKPTIPAEMPPSGPRASSNSQKQEANLPGRPNGPPINSNDRSRSDKRFAGINNVLSQASPPVTQDRNNQGTSIRGRHARNEAASSSPINNGPPHRDFPTPTDSRPPVRQDLFANRIPSANSGPPPRDGDGSFGRNSMRSNDRKPLPRPREARSRSPRRDTSAPMPRVRDDPRSPRQEEQRDFRPQSRQGMPLTPQSADRDRRAGGGGGMRENAGPSGPPRRDHGRREDWGGERGGQDRRERPERRNTGMEDGGSGRKRGRGPEEPYDQGRQMGHDQYQKRPRRGGPA